jgi:uncharacterized protein YeaO (DUF488 family)
MGTVTTRRIHEPVGTHDSYRVLDDGIWPRGLKKDAAVIDLWLKEAAPNKQLARQPLDPYPTPSL